ncbi:MAG: histidine phosphatase family protein [Chloroflexota bacterium]
MAVAQRAGADGRVWLVRHASTAWTGRRFCGRTDMPLSTEGRREAAALADRLAAIVPDDVLVVSAPTARARETAEWLVASLRGQGRVECDDRLREVDFGRAEGLTFDRLAETMPDLAAGLAAGEPIDWPGGESAASVRKRAADVWLDVRRAGRPGLLVTHGGFVRALLEVAFGRPALADVWIGPGAVVELAGIGRRWQIVSVESTSQGSGRD